MSTTTFTSKEAAVFRFLIEAMYAEPGFSDVDAGDVARGTGLGIHAVGGILTQLDAKGVLFVEELSPRTGHLGLGDNGEGVSLIYFTDKGEQYHERWAEELGVEYLEIIEREEA